MKKILLCLVTSIAASHMDAQISLSATAGTTTGTYTTLMNAFEAINAGTHQGAITINITSDVTETATAVLNASGGTSNYTSILVKPATGVNATISGSNANGIIRVNGGDNLTIDGSNNGTSSRNLTISNTFTAVTGTSPTVLMVTSTTTDGCDNITVKNTNLAGSAPTGTVACIIVGGSTLAAAEVPNNNFTAINNTFVRAQNAIFAIGIQAISLEIMSLDRLWLLIKCCSGELRYKMHRILKSVEIQLQERYWGQVHRVLPWGFWWEPM